VERLSLPLHHSVNGERLKKINKKNKKNAMSSYLSGLAVLVAPRTTDER
jgi:hypothetical protein